ncbi:hypothetical protein [Natronorubrum sp. DTA7]|uniref:hypothetical protein n=1 Tax=Natronorubrum sp. DTA7 TaxID=3447016 RepID=UPI003F853CCA
MATSDPNADAEQIVNAKTTREDWNDRYQRIVELFEATEDKSEFDGGHRIPSDDEPYVLHTRHEAPLRPDADDEHKWTIMLNPWPSPSQRTAWVVDGEPLLPKETAHGASEGGIAANDRDLEDVHSGRAVVCVSLTKVAGIHSRGETWIHCDEEIEVQFDNVLDELENEAGIGTHEGER